MRRAACRPGCASRAAASRSGPSACRSCRARSCSTCSTAATRTGAAFRPIAISATRRPRNAGADFSARHGRRRLRRDHGQPQGRARLGLGADARRRDRRRDRRGQRGRQRRPSATARISGRRRSSRTASSAGAACPSPLPPDALAIRLKGGVRENTTIALVATDAILTKAQAKRLAIVAHDGLARAIYPVHTPLDGDIVFAAVDRQARARRSDLCVRRAWRARRQCAGARGRARRV